MVTAINDVLTTLNRYVDLDSSSTDFQPVILRLDYLQRLVVNLAIDDFCNRNDIVSIQNVG